MIKRPFLLFLLVILLAPFQLSADEESRINRIVVFGDSLSDTGNLASVVGPFPSPPFYQNRVSNGPIAIELASLALELPISTSYHLLGSIQGSNFAVAGARTSRAEGTDFITQVNAYLASTGGVADSETLYVLFLGGNDIRSARNVEPLSAQEIISNAVQTLSQQLELLIQLGANNWFVVLGPDIGKIPESRLIAEATGLSHLPAYATELSNTFNRLYKQELDRLEDSYDIEMEVFNLKKTLAKIVSKADELGFSNTSDPCFSSSQMQFTPGCNFGANFDQYIYFDEVHPTAKVHRLVSEKMAKKMRDLLEIENEDHKD